MKMFVRPPVIAASSFALDVEASDTIDDVKALIRLRSQVSHVFVPMDEMRLYTQTGKQLLLPRSMLSDCNI